MFTQGYGIIRKVKMKSDNKRAFPDQRIVKNYEKAKEKNTTTKAKETTWKRRKKILNELAWWIPK